MARMRTLVVTQGDVSYSRFESAADVCNIPFLQHMAHMYPTSHSGSVEMCCLLYCIPAVELLCHTGGNAFRHRVRLHTICPIGRTPRAFARHSSSDEALSGASARLRPH